MIIQHDYILVADLQLPGHVDLVVHYKRPSGLDFIELENPLIEESQNGFYNITIPSSVITEYGTYIFKIEGYELEAYFEKECDPTPLYATVPPDICVVYGSVRNASAQIDAFEQIRVEARPLKLPVSFQGTFTLGKNVVTYTDYAGNFQLPLIRGMTALIEIKDVGVRFQAVIPDIMSVQLGDLIP